MKKEICEEIIDSVSSVTDVPKEDIVGERKNSDIIEARCLVVIYCKKCGISNDYIMKILNKKSNFAIVNMINQFDSHYKSSKIFQRYVSYLDNKFTHSFQ